MTPRRCLNKTAPAVVLHGSMFSKLCAPAQGRVPCTRAAAQAAALRLLYHDAAKRPQPNRTCCGFAWFNVLEVLCVSTQACAMHTRSRASGGFEVIIPYFSKLSLRVPLVFTKKHGIYAAKLMLRLRLACANRIYYTTIRPKRTARI